jgi:hypothetical protein
MAKMKKSEDFIYLYNKKVKISKLVQDFTVIPSHEIIKYLMNKELYLPKYVHKALIRKNIAPSIANAEKSDRFSDEMKYRLRWFDKFTIFQLEKLATGYGLDINVSEYKKDFWDIIIRKRTELGINNLEFVKLQNLSLKYAREPQESYEQLMQNFNKVYFEAEGYFDGSLIDEAKDVLSNASTLTEIRELGLIYGVEIPRRINKKQLVDIVSLKLGFDDEKRQELAKKSILDIERYAKRRQLNVSIELKKEDMIEYILLKMPKTHAPKYTNSLMVFAGMNIEEYLYNLKFQEIASIVSEKRKRRVRLGILIVITIGVLAIAGYIVYTTLI